jgi:hypothetical protein
LAREAKDEIACPSRRDAMCSAAAARLPLREWSSTALPPSIGVGFDAVEAGRDGGDGGGAGIGSGQVVAA